MAGDVRANENVVLTAIHTLFAREHNRIVASLCRSGLSDEDKFQLARRVVGAEIEYITYNAFLPALGVRLDAYRGYNPTVNPSPRERVRHGRLPGAQHDPRRVRADRSAMGLTRATSSTASSRRRESPSSGTGRNGHARDSARRRVRQSRPARAGRRRADSAEPRGAPVQERRADRQLAPQRALPGAEARQPGSRTCGAPVISPSCFVGVADLGAHDIQRGRDHGMPLYNDLRRALRTRTGAVVHGHHAGEHRPLSRPDREDRLEWTRSTIRTFSTSSGCEDDDGKTRSKSAAKKPAKTRSSGSGGRRSQRG